MVAEKLQKPLVVVTGSSGLIGSRLIEALWEDHYVIGLDVKPPNEQVSESEWIECDMTDDTSVGSALRQVRERHGGRIHSVVHLAAYYDFSGEPSTLYQELTVDGTRRLLHELRKFEVVEQFVFSSSLLVMKSADEDHPIKESSLVEGGWDYPQSKLAAEKVIQEERNSIPAVILRMAGVYDEDCHSIPIAQQISRIYTKQLEGYLFPGDKTHGQSFVHLDDLMHCFRCTIQRREALAPFEVFLIGEEDVMSYEELQNALGMLIHGKEWPTIRIPKVMAKAGAWVKGKIAADDDGAPFIKPWMISLADQNYPVNIHRARELLGWQPRHTLRNTLPEMIARLKRDPGQWFQTHGLPVPETAEAK